MEYLRDIFAAEDGYCDITNAFCFSKTEVFILVNAKSEDQDLSGSVLIKVALDKKDPTYEILHQFDSGSLDYNAANPNLHHILASGGYIHRIENGRMTFHKYASEAFLPKLGRMNGGAVAVFGEEGQVFKFLNGTYTQIPTPTDETLHSMHYLRHDLIYLAGDYGTLLRGTETGFAAIDLGGGESIRAVHAKPDGSVLLACTDGVGLVYNNDQIIRLGENPADFYAVGVFQGTEYWGDDDFGIYTRSGTSFVPKFQTGYGFNINTTGELMTINAGYAVYIFDGANWVHLKINPDTNNFVERLPLDFTPQ